MISEIGTRARPEIELLLGRQIFLELQVKVRPRGAGTQRCSSGSAFDGGCAAEDCRRGSLDRQRTASSRALSSPRHDEHARPLQARRPVGPRAPGRRATLDPWRRRRPCRRASSSRSSPDCRDRLRRPGRGRGARDDLSRRSIKREAKLFALDLAVRMMDLTTLEGADTPGKVAALASKAVRPDPADRERPFGRRGLRLSEPRADGAERSGQRRQSRVGRDGLPVRPVPDRPQGGRGRAAPSSSAPTRSTW